MTNPRARVLAVDDDPVNLSVLEELLAVEYDLTTMTHGSEVLHAARSFRPDLILLDIMLPDITGYDVCRQLRADPALRTTKVILVSAKAMVSERLQGYEVGADDYVTKPFNLDEFMAKVRVYLRLKSAEELEALKGHFLTLLSHETRTPLSSIMGASELLADGSAGDDGTRRELAQIIVENARRLRVLLERVTLLSELRSGKRSYACSPIDAVAVLRSVLADKEAGRLEKGVTLVLRGAESAIVSGNHECLHTMLDAVIDNAIRFSPPAAEVEIDVSESDNVTISVTDHGPGIDPSVLPHLWQGFRVTDLEHHSSGHGLSLAIASAKLSASAGALDVASEPGRGTRFTASFPAAGDRIERRGVRHPAASVR